MPSSSHASSTPSRSGARSSREYWFCTETKDGPLAGGRLRLAQLVGREVGAADLAHLARRDELLQGAERVGDGSRLIGVVQLVQVDVVGVEATQRVLTGRAHVVGLRAEVRVVDGHAELRRDDDVAAAAPSASPRKTSDLVAP